MSYRSIRRSRLPGTLLAQEPGGQPPAQFVRGSDHSRHNVIISPVLNDRDEGTKNPIGGIWARFTIFSTGWPKSHLSAFSQKSGSSIFRPPSEPKTRWDVAPRPQYLCGLLAAADEAIQENVREISAFEFGVAGGNGLLALSASGRAVEAETGVKTSVYGFDTGPGCQRPPAIIAITRTTGRRAITRWTKPRCESACRPAPA